jgi:hypothetical protein
MRRRALLIMAIMLGVLGMAAHAGAQAHPTSCPEFIDQSAAQTYFDAQGADYENLDADANGIACDESSATKPDSSTGTIPAVDALPSTGSGQSHDPHTANSLMAGHSILLLTGAVIDAHRLNATIA